MAHKTQFRQFIYFVVFLGFNTFNQIGEDSGGNGARVGNDMREIGHWLDSNLSHPSSERYGARPRPLGHLRPSLDTL